MGIEVFIIIFILGICIYYFSLWLLKKFKVINNRKIWAIIVTIILSPVIYFITIAIWIFSITFYIPRDFNQKKWLNNADERYTMTKNIINRNLLIGKTKQEVINLLGAEDNDLNKDYFYYYIGHLPELFNIDPSFISITFENEKVISVTQR